MNIEELREKMTTAHKLACAFAKSTGEAVAVAEDALELAKKEAHQADVLAASLAKLIGDPKTEDEIADPIPGGSDFVFKASDKIIKSHGVGNSTLTGETDTDDYGADARGVGPAGGAK